MRAAIEVIAERGWGGLTTAVVATRAGVDRALVHDHFQSVSALGREAAAHAMGALLLPAALQLLNAEDVIPALPQAICATLEIDARDPDVRVTIAALAHATRDVQLAYQLRQAVQQFRDVLAARLTTAQRAGTLASDVDPVGVSALLVALLDGVALNHLLDPGRDLSAIGPALQALLTPR